jgi:hypothetical protein
MEYNLDDVHYEALAKLAPQEVCERVGCIYDEDLEAYRLHVWGEDFLIFYKEMRIQPSNEDRKYDHCFFVFLINYLQMAKGVSLEKEWISEKDLPGGVTFFRGPHLLPTAKISDYFENDLESFKERCLSLGGSPVDNMGDAAYEFSITSSIPLLVIYWLGDEDFTAEARILFDGSMREYLPLDIVYALASELCWRIGHI